MYSDFLLVDTDAAEPVRVERLAFGNTSGRNEAWLQEMLFKHPNLLPVRELDAAFGPLIPLCRELRTPAGPIDVAFVNAHGNLTLVECKLWRNPEARRTVIAQILDYARALSQWSYSDLQRQVAIATGRKGNAPFEIACELNPQLNEREFVDQVAISLKQGRFLLVIAGDGIRQDVASIAELITRNASLGFSFGLVEVALYGMPGGELLVQPRVVARTQIIERTVVVIEPGTQVQFASDDSDGGMTSQEYDDASDANELGESSRQAAYRRWWQPVIDAKFDDPDQEPPRLFWPNHVRTPLPWRDAWITAYMYGGPTGVIGVGTSGKLGADAELLKALAPFRDEILAELPEGTQYRKSGSSNAMCFWITRPYASFADDDARRAWAIETLNTFVNALRPRVKRLAQTD